MWDGVNVNSSVCSLKMPEILVWTRCEGKGAVLCEGDTEAQPASAGTYILRCSHERTRWQRLRALSQSVEFGLATAPLYLLD